MYVCMYIVGLLQTVPKLPLSHENWEEIFMEDDAKIYFNQFLNMYLRIFHCCFIKE